MNLKQAAQRLGIHYQTAYKLVRSGSLVAIRIGRRYEVSEAAIERYEANLEARYRPVTIDRRQDPSIEIRAELIDLADRPFLDLEHVLTNVARRLAETTRDMCLLALVDEFKKRIGFTVGFESDPMTIPVFTMVPVLVSRTRLVEDAPLLRAIIDDSPFLLTHVSQDALWTAVPPEFHQYLDEWRVFSVVGATINHDGALLGAVGLLRDHIDAPFDRDAAAYLEEVGRLVGVIVHRAREDVAIRSARDHLLAAMAAESVASVLDGPSLQAMVDESPTAASIRTIEGTEYTNPAWRTLGPAGAEFHSGLPPRLRSGELDYFDETIARRVIHHAAVRGADSAVRAVVSAARSIEPGDSR